MTGLPGRLVMAREGRGLTAKQLSEISTVEPGIISKLQRDMSLEGVSAAHIVRLAVALRVPVGWLLAKEGQPPDFDEAAPEARPRRRPKAG